MTGFELRSEITEIEVIAVGRAVRALARLQKLYGPGRWRKLKGKALVGLPDGASSWLSYTGTKPTESAAGT